VGRVSELPDSAVRRWAEAAALLAGVGRLPAALLGWLGPAWSGPAARAFDEWASLFEQATRRTSNALRDASDSALLFAERWPELRFQADLDCVDAGSRSIQEVPVPGQRGQPAGPGIEPDPGPMAEPTDEPDAAGAPDPNTAPGLGGPPSGGPSPPRDESPTGLDGWIQEAVAVLRAHGYRPDQLDPEAIATIIRHESSGDPDAVNNWDANAARGTPSIGLMQTIAPTFDRWHLPGHGEIRDPVDNIIAGVRYAVDRYGSVSRVPGVVSLAAGEPYRGY